MAEVAQSTADLNRRLPDSQPLTAKVRTLGAESCALGSLRLQEIMRSRAHFS